jgi:hypothetical protein
VEQCALLLHVERLPSGMMADWLEAQLVDPDRLANLVSNLN